MELKNYFTPEALGWAFRDPGAGSIQKNAVQVWANSYRVGALLFFNLTVYWPGGNSSGPQTVSPGGSVESSMSQNGWLFHLPEHLAHGKVAWDIAWIRPHGVGSLYKPGGAGGRYPIWGLLQIPGTNRKKSALGLYWYSGSRLEPVSFYAPVRWTAGTHMHWNGWWEIPVGSE